MSGVTGVQALAPLRGSTGRLGIRSGLSTSPDRHLVRAATPLVLLLAVGGSLRGAAWLAHRPALCLPGEDRYIDLARSLTPDPDRLLGYALFLRVVSPARSLGVVTLLQHVMGLGLLIGVYVFLRRRGVRTGLAALACLPLAADAYLIEVEQHLGPEVLALALLGLALGLLLWRRWPGYGSLATAGGLLAVASLTVVAVLPVILLAIGHVVNRRRGWTRVAALGLGFAVVMGGYAAYDYAATGRLGSAHAQLRPARVTAAPTLSDLVSDVMGVVAGDVSRYVVPGRDAAAQGGLATYDLRSRPARHWEDPALASRLREYRSVGHIPGAVLALCLLVTLILVARPPGTIRVARADVDALLLVLTGVSVAVMGAVTAPAFDYRQGLALVVLLPVAAALALGARMSPAQR